MNHLLLTLAVALSAQFSTLGGALGPVEHFHSFLKQESSARQETLIEEIEIRGYRRIPIETIRNAIKSQPGDRYNPDQVRRDFAAGLALGVFDPLHTRLIENAGPRGGKVIIFQVTEYPMIRDLQFRGLKSVSESEAVARLKERIDLQKETLLTHEKINAAKHVIRELLAEKGHPEAKVAVEIENISATTVAIIFKIDE